MVIFRISLHVFTSRMLRSHKKQTTTLLKMKKAQRMKYEDENSYKKAVKKTAKLD